MLADVPILNQAWLYLVLCILYCIFSNKLKFHELEKLFCIRNAVKHRA